MAQRSKAKLMARVRRLRGQVEAVERAIEADVDPPGVLMLLAAVKGAANGIGVEVLGQHLHDRVALPDGVGERSIGVDEIVEVVRTYLK